MVISLHYSEQVRYDRYRRCRWVLSGGVSWMTVALSSWCEYVLTRLFVTRWLALFIIHQDPNTSRALCWTSSQKTFRPPGSCFRRRCWCLPVISIVFRTTRSWPGLTCSRLYKSRPAGREYWTGFTCQIRAIRQCTSSDRLWRPTIKPS